MLRFGSKFNCHIDLPQGLLDLYIGNHFNKDLTLPDGIQVVRLGSYFDKNIALPPSLRDVEFGYNFDRPVILPPGLERFTFRDRCWYSDHNIVLPDTLKYANIGCHVNVSSHDLPLGLEELVWHKNANIDIPLSMKHLTLRQHFHAPLELHEGLESIVFLGDSYNHALNLPRGLKSITLKKRRTPLALPDGCVHLS